MKGRFDASTRRYSILADPDGLPIELVAVPGTGGTVRESTRTIPSAHAIRGFHGVTLVESHGRETDSFLRETLGFSLVGQEGPRTRYGAVKATHGACVDVLACAEAEPGLVAVGTIHHVAWRTPDAGEQLHWKQRLRTAGAQVTSAIDRRYFTSIYFREPGGVLCEIATDPPGFARDEEPGALGTRLMLPPWLEDQRKAIERKLPHVMLPGTRQAA